jgi:L-asparaginase / beta-aspartyl-peptidase
MEPIMLVHGGAGDIPRSRIHGKLRGVRQAAQIGYYILMQTGCAMDAVEAAVQHMEIDDFFNAGYGAVLTTEGTVELEASVMDGKTLKAGCVAGKALCSLLIEWRPESFVRNLTVLAQDP